jgi:hypothetical protein
MKALDRMHPLPKRDGNAAAAISQRDWAYFCCW